MYRLNVGIVVCKCGKVLMCARADTQKTSWQFPQGGINEGEAIVDAAKRELFEETGIKSVRLITQIEEPFCYDFPDNIRKKFDNKYEGQKQYWVLFKFEGNDDEINLKINPDEIEFVDFEWTDIETAPQKIVDFKRRVYEKVVMHFACFVKECVDDSKI